MITTQTAPVRLTPQQVDAIRAAVADIFGLTAGVWLFGSRADLTRRGGDIDLYIEAPVRRRHRLPPHHRNFNKRLVKTPSSTSWILALPHACWVSKPSFNSPPTRCAAPCSKPGS